MSCWGGDAVLLLTKPMSPSSGGPQHAMIVRDVCPRCQSPKCRTNGHMHNGTPHHHCQAWSCPSSLRVNIRGLPGDRHKDKKA